MVKACDHFFGSVRKLATMNCPHNVYKHSTLMLGVLHLLIWKATTEVSDTITNRDFSQTGVAMLSL